MPLSLIPNQVNDPSTKLDVGEFDFSIEEVKEEYTTDDNRLFYTTKNRVVRPPSHAGQLHYERFYVGTDEDPGGMQPDTWTQRAGRLKKYCEAAGVPFTGQNPSVVLAQLVGKQLCGKIIHKPGETREGVATTFANIQTWGVVGSMTPHVEAVEGNSGQPVGAPATAPAPAPAPGQGSGMPPTQSQSAAEGTPSPLPLGTPRY